MDNLFPAIFVVIAVIASITSSAKKERERKAAEERRRAASPLKPKPTAPQQSHPYTPVQPTVMPSMSFGDSSGQVIAPTVHAHIKPDCDTHDVPGSLGVTSMEGKDPCHEDQLTLERTLAEVPQQESGLTFSWTGQSMVKAIVMQEVLNRPATRFPTFQRRAQ